MKQKLWVLSLIASFAVSLLPLSGVQAAEPDLLFNQTHNYSTVLRGNGEAIVYARIHLTNSSDKPMASYKFEIPRLQSPELVGYQVVFPKECKRYEPYTNTTYYDERKCLEYEEEPSDYDYVPENSTFEKLKFDNQGGSYSVTLPKPIAAEKSGILVLSYIGKGYVSQSFGVSSFQVETLKVDSRIKSAVVAVDVDSDLVLEGQRSKVNYNNDTPVAAKGSGIEGVSASNLRAISDSIGNEGGITKEAKNLAAGETLVVKGKYAESTWQLNQGKALTAMVILVAAIAALIWLMRWYRRKHPAAPAPTASSARADGAPQAIQTDAPTHLNLANPAYAIAGLVSATLIAVATVGLSIYSDTMRYSTSSPDTLTMIVVSLLVIIFYVLALLGPAIWMASTRRDWRVLIYVIVWEFAWLLVFLSLYQLGLKDFIAPAVDTNAPGRTVPMIDDCPQC